MNRRVKRLRAISDVMTEHARIIDYVLFDLITLRCIARVSAQAKENLNLLIAFEYGVGKKTDLLWLFAILSQPVCIKMTIIGKLREIFEPVYIDEMIRAVSLVIWISIRMNVRL